MNFHMVKILISIFLTLVVAGAGVGMILVFFAFLSALTKNPTLADQFKLITIRLLQVFKLNSNKTQRFFFFFSLNSFFQIKRFLYFYIEILIHLVVAAVFSFLLTVPIATFFILVQCLLEFPMEDAPYITGCTYLLSGFYIVVLPFIVVLDDWMSNGSLQFHLNYNRNMALVRWLNEFWYIMWFFITIPVITIIFIFFYGLIWLLASLPPVFFFLKLYIACIVSTTTAIYIYIKFCFYKFSFFTRHKISHIVYIIIVFHYLFFIFLMYLKLLPVILYICV